MQKKNLLLIEDEQSIADALTYALNTDGFSVQHLTTAIKGLELLQKDKFDLVILDVGLPDINGFEVCKKIRKFSQIPIFFLTARGSEIDKIVGLEIGADDYITKPFSPREVTARIKSLFRRFENLSAVNETQLESQVFKVDEAKFKIFFKSIPLNLTKYEYGLLRVLIKRPGQIFSREQLMQLVWNDPDMSLERTVDSHVKSLRSKLRDIANSEVIVTHRGLGYSVIEDIK